MCLYIYWNSGVEMDQKNEIRIFKLLKLFNILTEFSLFKNGLKLPINTFIYCHTVPVF